MGLLTTTWSTTFNPISQLMGSIRPLYVQQQVTALAMSFIWTGLTPNTVPVHVTFALYGPPTCGAQGDSQLLATTAVYTFGVGILSENVYYYYGYEYEYTVELEVLFLPLTTPVIVGPGNYTVVAEVDSVFLQIVSGPTDPGFQSMIVDAYTVNTYNYSYGQFPNVTFFSTFYEGLDTEAQIIGYTCVGAVPLSTFPVCVPKPFITIPASPTAALPCSGSSVVSFSTYTSSQYNYELGVYPGTIQLTPIFLNRTQTIYSVGLLFHPTTNASYTYTLRASLYLQQSNTTAYTLLAQGGQTIIPGSVLAGQFTEYFFPLLTPVTVAANTTVWLNLVVDQPGLMLVFDVAGMSLYDLIVISSNETSPAVLFFPDPTPQVDFSYDILSCAASSVNATIPPSNTCTGTTPIVTGPTTTATLDEYTFANQLIGSLRNITSVQQVNALSFSFYWGSGVTNAVPVHASLALYGPPSCGPQLDSQLLGVTAVYTWEVGALAPDQFIQLLLPLTTPVVVAPGTYAVMAEVDNPTMYVLVSATLAGYSSVVADAYTLNTYNFSNANFPASTYLAGFAPFAGVGHGGPDLLLCLCGDSGPLSSAHLCPRALPGDSREPDGDRPLLFRRHHQHLQQLGLLRAEHCHLDHSPPHSHCVHSVPDHLRHLPSHPSSDVRRCELHPQACALSTGHIRHQLRAGGSGRSDLHSRVHVGW